MKNIIEERYTPPFASYKHQLGYYVVRPLNWCGIWKQDEKTGEMLIGACNSMLRVDNKEEAELIADTFNRFFEILKENKKYNQVIAKLEFIKNRAVTGATQETINKLAIDFVNSYLKEEV